MSRKLWSVFSVLIVLVLALAACAPAATPTATQPPAQAEQPTATPKTEPTATEAPTAEMDPYDPAAVSGDIYTAGSSTVGPLTEAIIEMFVEDGFTGQIKNDIVGTGAGFERFCKSGETDISNASRKIKDAEVENCAKLNPPRTPIGFLVGLDAIAVVVNPQNDWVDNVTK